MNNTAGDNNNNNKAGLWWGPCFSSFYFFALFPILFVFVLFPVCPMFSVSLNCTFFLSLFSVNPRRNIMKRRFKQLWETVPTISTNHPSPQIIEHKKDHDI